MRCIGVFITVVIIGILASGCSQNKTGPIFGQSFNTIEGVSGDSYMLDGYTSFVEDKSLAFAPNAVLIVGVKDGLVLGRGSYGYGSYGYGSIVIVEGTTAKPTFRLATPNDRIVLTRKVTVFGKKHGKGRFKVPVGGKITPQEG